MSSLSTTKKIAILGAGAAGTTLFLNLVNQLIQAGYTHHLEIIIIEKSGRFGPGLAYSTQITSNLMNTPTFDLGIEYGDKLHFFNWLTKNESYWRIFFPDINNYEKNTPLPRKLYGFYLESMFNFIRQKAENAGLSIKLILDDIVDIEKYDNKYSMQFSDKTSELADIIISCIGLGKISKYPELKNTPGYILFPGEAESHILTIPKNKNVAIIGSRLSAIDSILLLNHAKRTGHTFVASRTANMPNVIGRHERYTCQYLTRENLLSITNQAQKPLQLKKLISLIKSEYFFYEGKHLEFRPLLYPKHEPITKFRYDIIKSTEKIRPWQAALYSTNSIVNFAWNLLSDEDKKNFQKHYSSIFQNQRIAMPIDNARKVYNLYREKTVSFYKNLSHINYQQNQYYLFFNDHKPIVATYLIDAAGLAGNVSLTDNRLIKNLIYRKIVFQDAFGFIHVNPNTMRVINLNNTEENFYVLGGLAQGAHLAANLMESIVELANQITESILKSLNEIN